MSELRILIVDDEPLIRRGIRAGLAKLDGVTVIGECDTGSEAIHLIATLDVNLVLLDVQLPDCTGIDVVDKVGSERMPMVIFVTAHDEYAVKAFQFNAIDYLLKPFDAERLKSSIERARRRLRSQEPDGIAEQLKTLLNSTARVGVEKIAVRHKDHYALVAVESIDWIDSASNYVRIHCAARTYLVGDTMNNMHRKLDPRKFPRVHRQHIVNIDRVVAIHPIVNGSYELELANGTKVNSGRQYKDVIQAIMRF